MRKLVFLPLVMPALLLLMLGTTLPRTSLAQEWAVRVKPEGAIRVVDLLNPFMSILLNCAEGLVSLDNDNNLVPCLAEHWRWLDDRTIEFKLREGVRFHNGERFKSETVKVNWEEYKSMENPMPVRLLNLPDEMIFKMIDEYTVHFTLPEPDGLLFAKLIRFVQIAPSFFATHEFLEKNWGFLPEAGPWGTGPFELVEGENLFGRPSDIVVLEAFGKYWDPHYPKVAKVIFDNTLTGDRQKAMSLCRESEGKVDIVSFIWPLDTLKVAESPFAKVVKSRDVTALGGLFNQRKRGSKWTDNRLRKAVNLAVNREELWKYGAKGNAHNFGGHIPPGAYGHNANLDLYTYDTDKARSLLGEAGYPDGFQIKIITYEAWKLEAQIIGKMLERIGLKVMLEILTRREDFRKTYIPGLDKPPEEQDWDMSIRYWWDIFGHTGAMFPAFGFIEESEWRWIEYDQVYEEMWKEMARTVDPQTQEEKIRQLEQYVYERAHLLFIYSPIRLYAVNKEANFIPQKNLYLRLKETSVTDNHWSLRGENQ